MCNSITIKDLQILSSTISKKINNLRKFEVNLQFITNENKIQTNYKSGKNKLIFNNDSFMITNVNLVLDEIKEIIFSF